MKINQWVNESIANGFNALDNGKILNSFSDLNESVDYYDNTNDGKIFRLFDGLNGKSASIAIVASDGNVLKIENITY